MLQFIYKIGDKTVDLADIHHPALKKSFVDLTSSLQKHFARVGCPAHHRSPTLFLHNDGSQAVLSGFGICCEVFGGQLMEQIKELGYDSSAMTWTTLSKYPTL